MIFIDTSAWIAFEFGNDVNHSAAKEVFSRIAGGEFGTPITSDHIIDEVMTFSRMKGGINVVENLEARIFTSPSLRILWTQPADFRHALDLMKQYQDKRFSLTDCISFWHMDTLEVLREALGEDL